MFRSAVVASFLLLSSSVFAQPALAEVPTIVVPAERAVLWPYRLLAAGLDEFERRRELAPRGQLRFKLRARDARSDSDTVAAGVSLTLVGNGWETPLPMDAQGRFVVPPSERAGDDDAQLVISGRRELYDTQNSPRVEVRSPGLPDNAMRMGDVRLECQVNQAIAKKLFGFMATMTLNALGGSDWCNPRKDNGGYALTPKAPFTRAVLVQGERRVTLYEGAARASISGPIHDAAWSDDALIEFSSP